MKRRNMPRRVCGEKPSTSAQKDSNGADDSEEDIRKFQFANKQIETS
jgi:hypothetical protein